MSLIEVLPYDSNWNNEFLKIKAELDEILDNIVIGIQHIGSTSVFGLASKPIIDIDIIIDSYDCFDIVKSKLSEIGYIYRSDLGIKDRHAFSYKDKQHLMKHHLYVCPKDSEELKRHLRLRDTLRNNDELRDEYGLLKQNLAKKYPFDIDSYIEGKTDLILRIIK